MFLIKKQLKFPIKGKNARKRGQDDGGSGGSLRTTAADQWCPGKYPFVFPALFRARLNLFFYFLFLSFFTFLRLPFDGFLLEFSFADYHL